MKARVNSPHLNNNLDHLYWWLKLLFYKQYVVDPKRSELVIARLKLV